MVPFSSEKTAKKGGENVENFPPYLAFISQLIWKVVNSDPRIDTILHNNTKSSQHVIHI